jgi:hypothetical protein
MRDDLNSNKNAGQKVKNQCYKIRAHRILPEKFVSCGGEMSQT